ncbi:hypothetical protein THRCLA_00131 [Thraustotheca clavata]|uniref:TFA2 Winged helix domain-containing protein n=1 Tax=Thraustotheca clavata TaxID=74557 RepID=A0A1W0AC55_9STRA|nr:hypothetical protein THRCLA_00131 [Thraustotheca clavata]
MQWERLARGQTNVLPVASSTLPMGSMASTSTEAVNSRFNRVLQFLNGLPGHRAASKQEIYMNTGIDINVDEEIRDKMQNNEKIRVVDNDYAYKAKFDVKNRDQLVKKLNSNDKGIAAAELLDCYVGIQEDLTELTRSGQIICIKSQDAAEVYYSRRFSFLTEVCAKATVEYGSYMTTVDCNTTEELRRGDCIRVGDHWFRVSNADKKAGIGNPPQPFTTINATTQSKSVSSIADLNIESKSKLKYILPFDTHHVPLDMPFPDHRQVHIHHTKWDVAPKLGKGSGVVPIVKHGCTNDIRELWKKSKDSSWPMDPAQLEVKLVQSGLSTQANVDAHRARRKMFVKNKVKTPRVRKQREIKITNTHLRDTALGKILANGGDNPNEFTLGAVKFDRE